MGPNVDGAALVTGSRVYTEKPDRRALYPAAFGIDMLEGEGVDLVHDLEQPLPADLTFSHVDCVSVLEHVRRPWLFAQTIERAMSPGATILLSVPWVWRVHGYPSDYWRFTPMAIQSLFENIDWRRFAYMSDSKIVRKVPKRVDANGSVWFARTELLAWGRRCES
jgi:SAM-dependent methyltransferase